MFFPLYCEPKQNRHFHSILSQTAQTPSLVGVRHPADLHDHCGRRLGRHRRDHDRGGERGIHGGTGDDAVANRPGAATTVAGRGGRRQLQVEVGDDDKEVVREYFNNSGFQRWKKIYGDTDEVNRVQRDIRLGHAKTVEKTLSMLKDEEGREVFELGHNVADELLVREGNVLEVLPSVVPGRDLAGEEVVAEMKTKKGHHSPLITVGLIVLSAWLGVLMEITINASVAWSFSVLKMLLGRESERVMKLSGY
ncbi:hypothetical protein JHK87_054108 [Glycine soja]|nr:hypothetical protein JHK87_054108 [Glycine soja]